MAFQADAYKGSEQQRDGTGNLIWINDAGDILNRWIMYKIFELVLENLNLLFLFFFYSNPGISFNTENSENL